MGTGVGNITTKTLATKTIEAAFAALPKTADQVAAYLQVRGIKGNHEASKCPIAVYLRGELEKVGLGNLHVHVGRTRVTVSEYAPSHVTGWSETIWHQAWVDPDYLDGSDERRLPQQVMYFVHRFDRDDFPELDNENDPQADPAVIPEPVAA